MQKYLIFLIILITLLSGCSNFTERQITNFVYNEQTSITYNDYYNFLRTNLKYVDPSIRMQFQENLAIKPQVEFKENKVNLQLVFNLRNPDNLYTYLFYNQDKSEYYLIDITILNNKIVNYTEKTMFSEV